MTSPASARRLAAAALLLAATTVRLPAQSPSSEPPVRLEPVRIEAAREDGYHASRARLATKTDTPLLDTPQSVTVLTQELLSDTAVTSIGEATRYLPGVGTAQGEGNRDTVVLRGNTSTGDYFVDGLRDDVQYYRDFYNIERLEALKGPGGMIFGRGGPGGVLNRVTKQAVIGGASFQEITALAGSWDQYRGTLDFNQSLAHAASLRLTGLYEDSDSFRDGVYLQRQGVNPTLGVALSKQTTLRAGFEYFADERVADRGIPSLNGRPFKTAETTFFGDPTRSPTDATVYAFNASLDHTFANGATLRNATRYATYDKFYQNVFPGTVNPAGTLVGISAYNQATDRENLFNQTDYVVDFTTGPVTHTMLVGLELGRQQTDNLRLTGSSTATGTTSLGNVSTTHPRYTGPLFFRPNTTDANNHSVADVAALYLQDQVQLLPNIQAIAGLRLDHFAVDLRNHRTGKTLTSSDDLLSPRAGLIYKPISTLALYTSHTLAYLPRAGEQLSSLSATNAALDPEKSENLEIGIKWDATPRLSLTAAAYQLDRFNQAITDPAAGTPGGPPPGTLMLVDGQQVRGIELGASGKITDRWTLTAAYAYQDGETQSANGAIPAGTRLPQLPRNTFSLWNRYDFNSTWGAGLGATYRAELFAAADNTVTLPGYVRFDAAVFYRLSEHLRAQLNVENLFDRAYYATAHNNTNITPGSPLAIRLTLTAHF
ncbi:MAG: TonB-dependent siderophore receptor [Verrucomicrobia bacterium]|nr:TonB-dependent siderophore receptor [Verrucomicrobiota bacterium]